MRWPGLGWPQLLLPGQLQDLLPVLRSVLVSFAAGDGLKRIKRLRSQRVCARSAQLLLANARKMIWGSFFQNNSMGFYVTGFGKAGGRVG
jgi:hypothetical protein